jgi:curved DNA-binding protein
VPRAGREITLDFGSGRRRICPARGKTLEFKDYYEVLGVGHDATQDEITRAYRKLARKYHPDVNKAPDAETRFKELGEAYEVLKDPEKRAAYDGLGTNWQAGQDFRPPPGWDQGFEFHGGGFTGADPSDFSDFFESLFGRSGGFHAYREPSSTAGADSHARILIDIEDSYRGATRSLNLRHTEIGADGRPQVATRTLSVRIPQGVYPGQHIRLAGQGSSGSGPQGRPGDLYLEVEFQPHRLFRAQGRDVYCNLPIAPWEAALGATIPIPTPIGTVDLKVPADSESGQKLRLKGLGIPATEPGDFYVILKIVLPPASDPAARAIYEAMRDQVIFDPRAEPGGADGV